MNKKTLPTLSVAALIVIIAGVVNVPAVHADTSQIRTPVNFVLAGCSVLPAGLTVSGSGESFLVANSRIAPDGTTYLENNNLVTGTATDSNGEVYAFNYHNHASLQIPAGGFPFTLEATDHFNLVGNGQANQFQVHFVARATFYSPTSFTIQFFKAHGNPMSCDPI